MIDRLRLKGPEDDELPGLVKELLTEIHQALSAPRWVLLAGASTAKVHLHAAAALRHVCALLEDVTRAAEDGREAALRVLGRAHLEAWLIGMYIVMGGKEALEDIASGYRYSLEAQHARLLEYDVRVKRDIGRARRANKRIRIANEGIAQWNAMHPEAQKPVLTKLPTPTRTPVDLDLLASPAAGTPDEDDEINRLVLAAVVARLNDLAQAEEGIDGGFDIPYDLAYRGLSTFGAHPTLWVINSYLDFHDRSIMVRTSPTMHAPSMATSVLQTALLETAALSQRVLALRETETPTADAITARYQIVSTD